jgi:hypothetical protein
MSQVEKTIMVNICDTCHKCISGNPIKCKICNDDVCSACVHFLELRAYSFAPGDDVREAPLCPDCNTAMLDYITGDPRYVGAASLNGDECMNFLFMLRVLFGKKSGGANGS